MSRLLGGSLRARLIVMFVLLCGATQIPVGLLVLFFHEGRLRETFDRRLKQRAELVREDLMRDMRDGSLEVLARANVALEMQEIFIQLDDATGTTIARSPNMGELLRFPPDFEAPGEADAGPLRTLRNPEVEALLGKSQGIRIVTLSLDDGKGEPAQLQVGASLQPIAQSREFAQRSYIFALLIGVVSAIIAGSVVTSELKRRLERVAKEALKVTPRRIDDRLPMPESDDEIGRMVTNLNRMLSRLEKGYRAQERFIHDASHELKTPLSVLLSQAQLLRRGEPSLEDYRDFRESVEEEMQRLGRLVESLLLLTRADARKQVVEGELVVFNEAVMEAVAQCQPVADEHQVKVQVQLDLPGDDEDELVVRGDQELLAAMTSNLVRNAIRFSPAEGRVEVLVSREGEDGLLSIRDHGPGIPDDELKRIFDRFHQANNGNARRGTGLGLTIARSVADLHDGEIHAENHPEGGGLFIVRFPGMACPAPAAVG